MRTMLLVGLGGFLGTVLRYLAAGALSRTRAGASFPYETFVINVAGCFLIGALSSLAESRGLFTGVTRAALFIGLLGGFTTFSTFGYETFHLVRGGQLMTAAISVGLQLTLGLSAVWVGDGAARLAWGK